MRPDVCILRSAVEFICASFQKVRAFLHCISSRITTVIDVVYQGSVYQLRGGRAALTALIWRSRWFVAIVCVRRFIMANICCWKVVGSIGARGFGKGRPFSSKVGEDGGELGEDSASSAS
jgi:hypothetical protein